jgi:hypothetical protein
MNNTNGNGAATTAPRVINGRGIAHRHVDKRRRAVLAADLADGRAVIQLSTRQLAGLLDVSETYIRTAQQLTPEKRRAILSGRDTTSFRRLTPPGPHLTLPAPGKISSDDLAHRVGPDRWLAAGVRAQI